ncbi:MAG: trypsin-like serine protease [Proteobacteria bacterium]|nr:trypsin-like serine protease [Pseudomonadota bacterium]
MACSQQQVSKSIGTLKIIGGKPALDGEHDETVAILRDGNIVCSGTLIEKKVVLTAGHCLEKFLALAPNQLDSLTVAFTNDIGDASKSRSANVIRAEIHPLFWQDQLSSLDLALLEISDDFDVKPADILFDRTIIGSMNDLKKSLEIVGFGITHNTQSSMDTGFGGIKHKARTIPSGVKGDEIFIGNEISDSCIGDSGGPVFANSNGKKLLAVTSRGPFPCARKHIPGISTLVVAGVCWINQFTSANDKELTQACANESEGFLPSQSLLEKLAQDQSNLRLSGKNLRDITWMSQGKLLKNVDVSWNRIEDASVFLTLPHLENVDIRGNQLKSLEPLEQLQSRGVKINGFKSQQMTIEETEFSKISAMGLNSGVEQRATILALRSVLTPGATNRRSRDLASRLHLDLTKRSLKSLNPLLNWESLEV